MILGKIWEFEFESVQSWQLEINEINIDVIRVPSLYGIGTYHNEIFIIFSLEDKIQ